MYIAAPAGRLGLRSAAWPFALVGLGATSPTRDPLFAMRQRVPKTSVALLSRDIGGGATVLESTA